MEKESEHFGLTDEEVLQIRRMGGGNPPPPAAGSAGQIVREHVCTLFNLFNVLIAAALAAVAERAAALGMRRLCHPQAAGKERIHRVPGA